MPGLDVLAVLGDGIINLAVEAAPAAVTLAEGAALVGTLARTVLACIFLAASMWIVLMPPGRKAFCFSCCSLIIPGTID